MLKSCFYSNLRHEYIQNRNISKSPGAKKKLSVAFHFYAIYYTVLIKQNISQDAA